MNRDDDREDYEPKNPDQVESENADVPDELDDADGQIDDDGILRILRNKDG